MIEEITGDITTADVDAIVNAANQTLLGGSGVDGAIHRAAGPALLEQCRKIPQKNGKRCPTGEARITGAGNLNAKYVIHTVGPVFHQSKQPELDLTNAYRSSLQLALEHNCKSIAIPAISTGAFGYPPQSAKQIALSVCAEFEDKIDIHLYFF